MIQNDHQWGNKPPAIARQKKNVRYPAFRNPLVSINKWSTQVVWYDVNPGFMERLTGWTPLLLIARQFLKNATSINLGVPVINQSFSSSGDDMTCSKHQDLMSEEWLSFMGPASPLGSYSPWPVYKRSGTSTCWLSKIIQRWRHGLVTSQNRIILGWLDYSMYSKQRNLGLGVHKHQQGWVNKNPKISKYKNGDTATLALWTARCSPFTNHLCCFGPVILSNYACAQVHVHSIVRLI